MTAKPSIGSQLASLKWARMTTEERDSHIRMMNEARLKKQGKGTTKTRTIPRRSSKAKTLKP